MDDERKLYPFSFCPIEDSYVWGRETFALADLGYRDSLLRGGWLGSSTISEVMEMYMDRVTGEDVFSWYGRLFPVQVKLLEIDGRMPLRVHPDDETASQRYDSLGKEKLWYILEAGKDASLWLGFREATDATALWNSLEEGSVESLLNTVAPHAGQFFHIPSGTLHGAAGKLKILEIAESSALDFCIYDWRQQLGEEEFDPSLTPEDALDFIDFRQFRQSAPKDRNSLLDIPQMRISFHELEVPMEKSASVADSFTICICISGEAELKPEGRRIKSGELVLVPAEYGDFQLHPLSKGTSVLEVTTPRRKEGYEIAGEGDSGGDYEDVAPDYPDRVS